MNLNRPSEFQAFQEKELTWECRYPPLDRYKSCLHWSSQIIRRQRRHDEELNRCPRIFPDSRWRHGRRLGRRGQPRPYPPRQQSRMHCLFLHLQSRLRLFRDNPSQFVHREVQERCEHDIQAVLFPNIIWHVYTQGSAKV